VIVAHFGEAFDGRLRNVSTTMRQPELEFKL
jgi:hypothetical protein